MLSFVKEQNEPIILKMYADRMDYSVYLQGAGGVNGSRKGKIKSCIDVNTLSYVHIG